MPPGPCLKQFESIYAINIGCTCGLNQLTFNNATMRTRPTIHRTKSTKSAALTLLKHGAPVGTISKDLKIPRQTLYDWKNAAIASGTWADNNNIAKAAPRKSDPGTGSGGKLIDKKLLRKIKKKFDNNPFMTVKGVKRSIKGLANVSERTIRRAVLEELELPSRTAAKKPFLTDLHKTGRVSWAIRHRNWSRAKWSKVLWSDETHIELWNSSRYGYFVRRHSSVSRYDPSVVRRTVKFPPKLMIWAAFGNSRLGSLYFVKPNAKMNATMYIEV